MIAKDPEKVTLSTSTILSATKSDDLQKRGGLFLFGYRLVDDDDNVFNDPRYFQAIFETQSNSYDVDREKFVTSTITYFEDDCNSVFETDMKPILYQEIFLYVQFKVLECKESEQE